MRQSQKPALDDFNQAASWSDERKSEILLGNQECRVVQEITLYHDTMALF